MSSNPLQSLDEWMWRTDLAARQAEAAGFSCNAEAFRVLSNLEVEGSAHRAGWLVNYIREGVDKKTTSKEKEYLE